MFDQVIWRPPKCVNCVPGIVVPLLLHLCLLREIAFQHDTQRCTSHLSRVVLQLSTHSIANANEFRKQVRCCCV
uniref:Secreted protein n=1 Tax=Mesocestoides corti TaxID=53468 RepID=A0A5K3G626_MESCO